MILAGTLDRRINILEPTVVRDAMGAAIEQFSVRWANVPCSARPFTGREKYKVESAREMTYKQYKFTVRYISGLNQKHRIVFEGETFDILYISELVRRQGLEILAQVAK